MQTRSLVAVLALLALAAACSKQTDNNQLLQQFKEKMASAGNAGNSGGEARAGDPCGLLDPSEVAKAIGPLALPPYRGTNMPQASAEACRYDTKDHRRMVLSVDWSGGAMAMKVIHFGRGLTDGVSKGGEMKVGATVLSSGDTLVGGWDEIAQGPMQCCDLHARRGDQHVELDWTGTRLTPVDAGALLDAAVKRLDHPLGIDGRAGMSAAEQAYAALAKDSMVNMCTLVPQADAEAILGAKLAGPPENGTAKGAAGLRQCTYRVAVPAGQMPREYDVTLWAWRDGAVSFAEDQYTFGGAMHAMKRQFTGDTTAPPTDTTQNPIGPWEEAGPGGNGYEAVKGPFLVRVVSFGDRKGTLGLLAKAITALNTAP